MHRNYPKLADCLPAKDNALLARYFQAFASECDGRGLTFRLVPPQELEAVHAQYAASWNGLTPVLDHRTTNIPEDTSACLVGYDRTGAPAVAHGCRLFDFGTKTVKSAFEDLSFWYGDRAHEHRGESVCSLTSPSAATMSGRVLYIGAFWVRPDLRTDCASQTIQELSRCYGCSRWDFDHIVTVGSGAFRRTDLQMRYGFDGCEDGFQITMGGQVRFRGLFLWSRRQSQMERLEAQIETYEIEAKRLRPQGRARPIHSAARAPRLSEVMINSA